MQTKVKANGKVALITGGNSGLGAAAARELALKGYHLFLACRDSVKTQEVINSITQSCGGYTQIEFIQLDLSDFQSIRSCAKEFLNRGLPLDLLLANAGLAGSKGKSHSGFELTFGVCHLGHFLLTQLLLPALTQSEQARVVVVSSNAHRYAPKIDWERLHRKTSSFAGLKEYAVAKLCNILFVRQLSKQLHGTTVSAYCVHPGVVATNVWRTLPKWIQPSVKKFMLTPEQGAKTLVYCATADPESLQSGGYYVACGVVQPSKQATDWDFAEALWHFSETNAPLV